MQGAFIIYGVCMNIQKVYVAIRILAVIGIALALYLLYQQFAQPTFQPCNINETVNCDAIISGEVSKTLGVPTPLFGLVGYIIILTAAVLKKKKLLLGMASFGLAFCLWIGYREIFELSVICPICLICLTVMATVFALAVWMNTRKPEVTSNSL